MDNILKEKLAALKNLEALGTEDLPKGDKGLSNLLSIPRIEATKGGQETNDYREDEIDEDSIFGNTVTTQEIKKTAESEVPQPLTKQAKINELLEKLYNLPHDNKEQSAKDKATIADIPQEPTITQRNEIKQFARAMRSNNNVLSGVGRLEGAILGN